MANILVHAVAATAGGGKTYLHHMLRLLPELAGRHRWHVLVPAGTDVELPPASEKLTTSRVHAAGRAGRFLFDQMTMRRLIREHRSDAILATGNFGMLRPPVPQVLLSRCPVYFSHEHSRRLLMRRAWGEWLNAQLRRRWAIASIKASTVTVTPTAAFGDEVMQFVPHLPDQRLTSLHHGFDFEQFTRPAPLASDLAERLGPGRAGTFRLLMVSHYNYFRNFETLLKAVALVRQQVPAGRRLQLVLTTRLGEGVFDHRYDTTQAARLVEDLQITDAVTMLGHVPYSQLFPLYQACDAVVCPSYLETFGHPMVEAMASGRPLIAADTPVHREVCGGAALHFAPFDAQTLADQIQQVMTDASLAGQLAAAGPSQAKTFSWQKHFEQLANIVDHALAIPHSPRVVAEGVR